MSFVNPYVSPGSLLDPQPNVPINTHRTFGALLVGHFLTMIGFGFTFFQTYSYFSRCLREGRANKAFAGAVSVLDLVITALVSRFVYYELVTSFHGPQDLTSMIASSDAEYLLSAFVVFVAQLFYSYQVWLQTKKIFIALPMAIFSSVALALMAATGAKFFGNNTFVSLSITPTKSLKAAGLFLTFAVAMMHATVLGYDAYWREKRSAIKGLGALYDRFILCFVDPGALAAAVQLGYFIAFIVAPASPMWLPFHFLSTKLFVNGCLSFLTSTDIEGSLVNESGERFGSRNQHGSRISAMGPLAGPLSPRSPNTSNTHKVGFGRLSVSNKGLALGDESALTSHTDKDGFRSFPPL